MDDEEGKCKKRERKRETFKSSKTITDQGGKYKCPVTSGTIQILVKWYAKWTVNEALTESGLITYRFM